MYALPQGTKLWLPSTKWRSLSCAMCSPRYKSYGEGRSQEHYQFNHKNPSQRSIKKKHTLTQARFQGGYQLIWYGKKSLSIGRCTDLMELHLLDAQISIAIPKCL
jgi:hypothetical protein